MSQQQQQTPPTQDKPAGSVKKRQPRKDSRLRQDAKSKFNASAPPMSSDKFFSDYTELHRNNVDVTYDDTFIDRVAAGYVNQANMFAQHERRGDDENYQAMTHSLISMATIRKLMLSAPQTELSELSRIRDIADHELFVPKNLAAVLSSLGKFELDDFVARIKYNVQDVYRALLATCKIMNRHSDFRGRYFSPLPIFDDHGDIEGWKPWDQVDPSKVVLPAESSTRWLRDQAKTFLEEAYLQDWEVMIPGPDGGPAVPIRVTYPKLPISKNPETQVRNVAAWFAKLSEHHPNVHVIAAAGLATAWQTYWTRQADDPIRDFADLPEWYDSTARDVLTELGLDLWSPSSALMLAGNDTISMIRDIHLAVKDFHPHFTQFLDVTKMPDDKFGSEAQMFALDPVDYVEKPMLGLANKTYFEPRVETSATTIAKFKNKGNAVLGLVAGLSTKVEVRNNYRARANGSPATILRTMLSPDYRRNY
jgi:hypothetical protein